MSALDHISTKPNECADSACEVCSGPRVVHRIDQFLEVKTQAKPAAKKSPKATVDQAKKALGCGTEACVVEHPELLEFVAAEAPEDLKKLRATVKENFKPAGPRNTLDLLSNFDIDGILSQWSKQFPGFRPCPFSLMDFREKNGPLARVSLPALLSAKTQTFACVLNTARSHERGKHWVCVFVDMRGAVHTVEYFNSAGNPPPRPVTQWMEETADALRAHGVDKVRTEPVTSMVHQRSQTECGLYVLFYIRARLEGVPISFFRTRRVPDKDMTEFRRHVFR